jgi:putative tryptophan/tyrosine transport system substrate-binding protein
MKRREFIAGLGSAAVSPIVAQAQQPAMPVIGFLTINTESTTRTLAPFLQGLHEQGFVEGRNVEILPRYAEAHEDRLDEVIE